MIGCRIVAPEVLNYEPLTTNSDMWSAGVLSYMLLSGYSPFAGDDKMQTFSNITQAKVDFPDDYFQHVSSEARDFIRRLLVRNPRYVRMCCLPARSRQHSVIPI